MRLSKAPSAALASARYNSRCKGCRGFLARGLPIFLLEEGWGCYSCHQDELVRWHSERVLAEARDILVVSLEEKKLLSRLPDDCSRPARRIAPWEMSGTGEGR